MNSLLKSYLIHNLSKIEQTTSSDSYGKPVYSLLSSNVGARVERVESRTVTKDGREVTADVNIYIDSDLSIKPQYRVYYNDEVFEVVNVETLFMFIDIIEYQVLHCIEVTV